jgi:Tol biopolymer transport system component
MNANGGNPTRLTFNPQSDTNPAWSPDRTKIAFTSTRDGNPEIYVMNADGTSRTRLTFTSAFEDDPSWSPDGTKITFWSSRDGNPEIYIMNANGPIRLASRQIRDPTRSRNGRRTERSCSSSATGTTCSTLTYT